MNITSKFLRSACVAVCAMVSINSFAATDQAKAKAEFEAMAKQYQSSIETAAKSSDVRGGLIKACGVQYKKALDLKMLTQADVTKLCTCTTDAEGQVTQAQKWEIQSAVNAKNQAKFQELQGALVKKQGESVKKCVGTTLDQKLSKLAQQAMAGQK